MAVDLEKLHLRAPWQNLTTGMMIHAGGTSTAFHTGEWTAVKPEIHQEKCKKCGRCQMVCPDSAIEVHVVDNARMEGPGSEKPALDRMYQVNVNYCKGCGICAHNCPFDAIEMGGM